MGKSPGSISSNARSPPGKYGTNWKRSRRKSATTKQREFQAKSAQAAKSARLQVEKLLTAEQWTAVKAIALGMCGLGRLMSDRQFRETLGVAEQQTQELSKRFLEGAKAQGERRVEALKENEEKSLAAITPQQWNQIEQIVGNSDAGTALLSTGGSPDDYPGPEWQVLVNPDVRKQLALSADQRTKLDEFSAKSRAQSLELANIVEDVDRPLPAKDRAAKQAELHRKLQEMKKQDRERIEGLLTAHTVGHVEKTHDPAGTS